MAYRIWLRGAVFVAGVFAYRVTCDLLDKDMTDAYLYGALTAVCGVIIAISDLVD